MESSFANRNLLQTATAIFRKENCQRKKPVRLSPIGKTQRHFTIVLPYRGSSLVQFPLCGITARDRLLALPCLKFLGLEMKRANPMPHLRSALKFHRVAGVALTGTGIRIR